MKNDIEVIKHHVCYDPCMGVMTRKNSPRPTLNGKVIGSKSVGYLEIRAGKGKYLAHRAAWAIYYGTWPNGQIDHINGIKTDNRITNLRCVSSSDNNKNRPISSKSKTGLSGVGIFRNGKWFAGITSKSNYYHLGYFDNLFEACCARKAAEIHFNFHENHGRPLVTSG